MMKYRYFWIFLCCFLVNKNYAQTGLPDTTFGEQGIAITDVDRIDFFSEMVLQSDQKILVAGNVGHIAGIGGDHDIAIIRYNTDGALDESFGEHGIMHIHLDHEIFYNYSCNDIALQPDDKLVVVGNASYQDLNTFNIVEDFLLARLNTDGSLDSTFGINGIVISDVGTGTGQDYWEAISTVLIQEDGKIIAAGLAVDYFTGGFVMARYLPNGELDLNFGNQGIIKSMDLNHTLPINSVIQPDGKIVFAGRAPINPEDDDFSMTRYFENGTIDIDFGDNGFVQTDLQSNHIRDLVSDIILEPDGKIVLCGAVNFLHDSQIGIVRYHSNGSLDTSFGNNGIYLQSLGSESDVKSIARQSDGKYVLALGSDLIDTTSYWMLERLTYNGTIDSTFGNEGLVITDLEGQKESTSKILIQSDSRILVGGFNNGNYSGNRDIVLARYFSDFIITPYIVSDIMCPDDSMGSITLEVQGGQPPYHYSIDGLSHHGDPLFEGLPAGEYFITITDSNVPPTFTTIGPLTIPEPPGMTGMVEVTGNSIIVHADHHDFILYSINGTEFQEDSIFQNVMPGTYPVFVITTSGCTIQLETVTILSTSVETFKHVQIFAYPNPCEDFLIIEVSGKCETLNYTITNSLGQLMQTGIASSINDRRYEINTDQLFNGIFQLCVINNNNCGVLSFVKGQ